MSRYLPSLRSRKKNQSQRALPPPEQTSSFVSLEEMPKRVTETSAGAAGVQDPKRLAIQEDPLKEEKDNLKRQIEKLTSDAASKTGIDRYSDLVLIARVEWKLAKLEYPNDLVQLEAARKALVDAEITHEMEKKKHEIEKKKQNVMQLLPNATGELKEKLQQQLLDAIEAESHGSARETELRQKFEATYAMPSSNLVTTLTFEEFEERLNSIPMKPETSTNHPDVQARLLGAFNRPDIAWPVVRRGETWRIDFELMPSLFGDGQEIRPAALKILDELDSNTQPYHLMLAVSGSGKTSAFGDVARRHFVIYIQCTSLQEQADVRRSRGYDAGFVAILEAFKTLPMDKKTLFEGMQDLDKITVFDYNAEKARRLFMVEILCRLAQLYRLLQLKPDLTPFEFYVHQRNVGDEWISDVRRKLRGLSPDVCEQLVKQMRESIHSHLQRNDCKLLIAVDEIEVAANEFFNQFDQDKSKNNGILSPLIRAISSLETSGRFRVIFTGTASSFDREKTFKSGLNKPGSLLIYKRIPKMFPHVTVEACRKVLSRLNIQDLLSFDELSDDVEFDPDWTPEGRTVEEIVSYAVVGGRFRTLTRAIHNITQEDKDDKFDVAKRMSVLYEAFASSVKTLREDFFQSFNAYGGARDDFSTVERFNDVLARLWTGVKLNGGRITITKRSDTTDLMKLGVGNYAEINESSGYYILTERVVAMAILDYVKTYPDRIQSSQYGIARDAFQHLVATHGNIPARGNMFEHLTFRALLRPDFQGRVVGELPFVQPFVPLQSQEKWWMATRFEARGVKYHHSLNSPQESTPMFLGSESALGVVFSPETVARFDAALKLDAQHAMVFAITMWNGSVPNDKVKSQIGSTDLSKAYFLVDGTRVNQNCIARRTEWESLGLDKLRAIRIHIALPKFNAYAVREMLIDNPDELGIHLDQSNCHLLFGRDPSLYQLLAIATGIDLASWPGASL